MLHEFFYQDGKLVTEMLLHERRYHFLRSKDTLTEDQKRELSRNKFGKMIHESYNQAVYSLMAMQHIEKGLPKD